MKRWRSTGLVILGLASSCCWGEMWYTVTDLGGLGGDSSWAYGIADSGEVVGHSLLLDPSLGGHSFLYRGGVMSDLYPFQLGFTWGSKYVNNRGQIAGSASLDGVLHPALCEQGQIIVLPSLGFGCGGGCTGEATAINNVGQAAGWSSLRDDLYHAVLWSNGTITDLGSFGAWSHATSLNDLGMVVGLSAYERSSPEAEWVQHPFLYIGGNLIDLAQFGLALAVDVNNRGQIVGMIQQPNGFYRAAMWADGVTTDLHGLGVDSEAAAINEHGQVVGSFRYVSGVRSYYDPIEQQWVEYPVYSLHPCICEGGMMTDLNERIFSAVRWELQYATDINNAGQIVGWGLHRGTLRGFLLSPSTPITIDIKPRDAVNVINPDNGGFIPVAILTTDTFDAATVDAASVRFGVDGTEVGASIMEMDDVNKDKRPDLMLLFATERTGIRRGDTAAIVTGRTRAGASVTGQDVIRTTPVRVSK